MELSWFTLGLAIATTLLAVAAFLQLGQSAELVKESVRARADQLGPRVSLVMVQGPARAFAPATLLGGQETPLVGGQVLQVPEHREQLVRTLAWGYIANDGDAGVIVRVPPELTFPEVGPIPEIGGVRAGGIAVLVKPGVYAIGARTTVALRFAITATVAEWATAYQVHPGPAEFRVTVSDHLEHGVEDTYRVEITAFPLEPVTGRDDQWIVPVSNVVGAEHGRVEVHRAHRRYRQFEG